MCVQAMQNQAFIAMCNRVGTEDKMQFAGESIVIHPGGEVIAKVNDQDTEYYYYGEEINGDYI